VSELDTAGIVSDVVSGGAYRSHSYARLLASRQPRSTMATSPLTVLPVTVQLATGRVGTVLSSAGTPMRAGKLLAAMAKAPAGRATRRQNAADSRVVPKLMSAAVWTKSPKLPG
jgi:hypothetical protein